jgi:putative acetyltransferase
MLIQATRNDYNEILEVWEASVRATHHFLKEEHIQMFKPLILNKYLDAVQLWCFKNREGKIAGFLGVAHESIEMLFMHPDSFGTGLGREMVNFAIKILNVKKVDVNEQNQGAVGFCHHMGFKTIGRSETDGLGLPYPILHMEL